MSVTWRWNLGDELEWTWGRGMKHRGTIVAFLEPRGVLAQSDATDREFGGGRVRVDWADVRRPVVKKPRRAELFDDVELPTVIETTAL